MRNSIKTGIIIGGVISGVLLLTAYVGSATVLFVPQGGTATSSFPVSRLLFGDGNLAIQHDASLTYTTSTDVFAVTATSTFLSGYVGIGTAAPVTKLSIKGIDDKDTGAIITLNGNAINQFESGRIRFAETDVFYQGGFIHFDGSANTFNIGVHDNADNLTSSDINAMRILRSNGNVGIGTVTPEKDLEIFSNAAVLRLRDTGASATATTAFIEFGGTDTGSFVRTGFMGDASSANTDISIRAEISDLLLGDSSGSVLTLSGGDVGIGTTTPSTMLSVGATSTQQFLVNNEGVISDGVWQGTTIAVNQGGTGASTLADLITLGTDSIGAYVADLTAGTAIDVSGGGAETANITVNWDSTEVATTTWGSGAGWAWTFNTGGTSPIMSFLNGVINISTGALQVAGNAVLTTVSTLNDLAQTSLADPGADQLVFWDDGSTVFNFIDTLTGLSISGTTLSVDTVDFGSGTNATGGNYITLNGDAIDADPELASTTIPLHMYDATATAPYKFQQILMPFAGTISSFECSEYSAGTTTIQIYRSVSISTTTDTQAYLASIDCGIAGTSTTSFTTTTVPIDTVITFVATSTAGTLTYTRGGLHITKDD